MLESLEGWDASGLKTIASAIAERPGYAAILVGGPEPASIAIARGDGAALDAGAIVKAVATRFGGKGGGRPDSAQGGGLRAQPAEVVAYVRTVIASAEA